MEYDTNLTIKPS